MNAASVLSKLIAVAIYARYSTDRQDSRSIEDQIRRCRAYAETHGYSVVAVYHDAAESGAHLEREGLQLLLADARKAKRCPFRVVLVDDLSRLSRDLGNTWALVFHHLGATGVKVIDCRTGMHSDAPGARLTFGATALVDDTFLELVRSETHRGLSGRAKKGFWTGGRLYGYSTIPEPNPEDPEHQRKKLVINDAEATTVRRIFEWYAVDQLSVKKIVRRLNSERIPPPSAATERRCTPGWAPSQIVSMVDNEAYKGRIIWNKRKWLTDPHSGKRHYVERPKEEWVTREDPSLAIVSNDLWQAAQERRAESKRRFPGFGTGPIGDGRTPGAPVRHMLSGVLVCGTDGSTMQITGGKGESRSYGCPAHKRGDEFCANGLSVSKAKVERCLIGELQRRLNAPDLIERMSRRLAERLRGSTAGADGELRDARAALAKAERALANLLDLAEAGQTSRSIVERIKAKESERDGLATKIVALEARPKPADVVPSPALVRAHVEALGSVLNRDVVRGRAFLQKHVGHIVLTPVHEGPRPRYRASGQFVFDPGAFPRAEQVAGAGFEPATFGL
jgi:DNA invertase Pin-like site-specific DNA recombinase